MSNKPQIEMSAAAASVRAMVDDKVVSLSRKRAFRFSAQQIQRARIGMEARAMSGDWGDAAPSMLVALYEWLHREVYGVAPAELDGRAWAFATAAAKKLVATEFAGDMADVVDFMKWVWKREEGRERWRREHNRDGSRIGWRLQFFPGYLLTDYRISKSRVAR